MIGKFGGLLYLIAFIVHFTCYAIYGFICVFFTKSFLNRYGMDYSGAIITRFFGSLFIGSCTFAFYIMFFRDEGVALSNWGFFTLIFFQNLSVFIVGIYTIKINKLGHTSKTSIEGVIASGILTILSAIIAYGIVW